MPLEKKEKTIAFFGVGISAIALGIYLYDRSHVNAAQQQALDNAAAAAAAEQAASEDLAGGGASGGGAGTVSVPTLDTGVGIPAPSAPGSEGDEPPIPPSAATRTT